MMSITTDEEKSGGIYADLPCQSQLSNFEWCPHSVLSRFFSNLLLQHPKRKDGTTELSGNQ